MRFGVSGQLVMRGLLYADTTNHVCVSYDFFPCVAYAIFWQESIEGEVNGKWDAKTVVSGDGGHGIGQLTSSWPDNWQDPVANITYAVEHFMVPALQDWQNLLHGDDLVRAIAATYNAGFGQAWNGHVLGDLDMYTTDRYGERALATYRSLTTTGKP